jgi:hypothetical protein
VAIIHNRVARRINDVLVPPLRELIPTSTNLPAEVENEDDPDVPTDIHFSIANGGLMARLYLEDKDWILWVYKSNKNGTVSKKFREKFITLSVPTESFDDDRLVLREVLRTVLSLESHSDAAELLMADPYFQNHSKPAMKAALNNPSVVSTREERMKEEDKKANEQVKQEKKVWFWIIGIFVVLFLLTSNSGSELPNDCNYVPDPRGGYSDC